MATIVAAQAGDWSDTATWVGGVAPASGDIADAYGYVVDIDGTQVCSELHSTVNGGWFELVDGCSITVELATYGIYSLNQYYKTKTLQSTNIGIGQTATVVADVYVSSRYEPVRLDGAGTVNWTGDLVVAGTNHSGACIEGTAGTLNLTGDVSTAGTVDNYYAIYNFSGMVINITGNLSAAQNACVLLLGTASLCTIVGDVETTGSLPAINGYPVSIDGTVTNNGKVSALQCRKLYLEDSAVVSWAVGGYTTPATPVTLLSPDSLDDNPLEADVRSGTTYGPASELTGTMSVPPAASVSSGVAVDATTGTAVAVTAADVWDVLTSTLTTSGSIGERLKNAASVTTVGDQVTGLE